MPSRTVVRAPAFASQALSLFIARLLLAFAIVVALLCLVDRAALADAHAPSSHLRRYALIASSNNGGGNRAQLRFANSDAKAMSDVLMQLGGLDPRDLIMLPNANRTSVEIGFDKLRTRLQEAQAPGTRKELFVYYSGHSDEEGLLLGSDRITYRELRQWIQDLGADVRIAILDSCSSGAMIRLKGGAMRAPFLADVSSDARGHAFLTASSADESAQESDRVGAAFFTHYLVSGLRGAADSSRDGKVTLGEAYQFAYDETLRRTEKSHAGAQHAAYDIQLAGTGDLVMTDLRATDATLVLNETLSGRIYVRDAAGRLLVELRKEPVYPVELGLGPGTYRVLLDADGRPFETNVTLEKGKRRQLAQNDFAPTTSFVATLRGDGESEAQPLRDVAFDLVAAPGVRLSGHPEQKVRHRFVLGLLGHSDELRGVQLSLGGNIVEGEMRGAQFATGLNLSRGYGRGAQFSSGVNMALGGFYGLQTGALLNVSHGAFTGVQAAMFNWSEGDFKGVQAAVINYNSGKFVGFAPAVINVNRGEFKGFQAGVVNLAGVLDGSLQMGVVNIGGTVTGAQIGVVNVASKVKGTQIGVVNVANSMEGASVGIIPFVRDGYHGLSFYTSDTSRTNVSLKLGARHFYTVLGGGITKGDDDRQTYSTHLGLGFHITPPGGPMWVDLDVVGTQMGNSSDYGERDSTLGTLRAVLGYSVAKHFALTLGPTFNVETSWNKMDYKAGLGVLEKVYRDGDTTVRLYPGFVLGVQI